MFLGVKIFDGGGAGGYVPPPQGLPQQAPPMGQPPPAYAPPAAQPPAGYGQPPVGYGAPPPPGFNVPGVPPPT